MTKAAIRKEYRKMRDAITDTQRLKWQDLILIRFQQLEIDIPDFIMTYAAMDAHGEFDPEYVVEFCRFKNPSLEVCYPVIAKPGNHMVPVKVQADTAFSEHAFGMEEPVDGEVVDATTIDLVLVPLLAFDKKGYRVGFGKGYYDKFLKTCRPDAQKVGISFFEPLAEILDIHEGDVKLNYCITPDKTYTF